MRSYNAKAPKTPNVISLLDGASRGSARVSCTGEASEKLCNVGTLHVPLISSLVRLSDVDAIEALLEDAVGRL